MKYSRRLLAVAAVAAVAALAGCTGGGGTQSSSNGKPSGTLTGIYDAADKAWMDKIVADFEKQYPGVKVNMTYTSTGNPASVVSAQLQAGTAPDVFLTFPGGVPKAGGEFNVVPLASLDRIQPATGSWTNSIPAIWKEDVSYEGKVYSTPGAVQGLGAIYNATEMAKLGLKVPTTLDEVYALCSAAKAKGVYAYAQGLGDANVGPQMLSFAQSATLVYGPDPKFTQEQLDKKATFQSNTGWLTQFQIYKTMFTDGCFGEGALGRTRQQGFDAVAAGKALGAVDVGAALGTMQKAAPSSKFEFEPMPATNSASDTYAPVLTNYVMVINAKAKNPVAANAWLSFLATPEITNIYANGLSGVPAVPNSQYTAPAELKGLSGLLSSGKFTKLPLWPNSDVQVTLNQVVQSMLLDRDTPKSALEKMQTAFNGS